MTETDQDLEMEEEISEDVAAPQSQQGEAATAAKSKKVKDPCIICSKNTGSGGAIQCTICTMWCHTKCSGLSKEILKGLEVQARELGITYWACRSCTSFNHKVNTQLREVNKRQDATDKKVEENKQRIEAVNKVAEEAKNEVRAQANQIEELEMRLERKMAEELREREARRLNLIIHGVPELNANIPNNRDRMEKDKEECERIFKAMGARTRAQDLRFCRRIGERRDVPRPIVIGVSTELEKKIIMDRARELRFTAFEQVSIVPDLTKSQRRDEQ